MSELTLSSADWRDFLQMCKPRVVLLMLLCTLVGMFLAVPSELTSVAGTLAGRLSVELTLLTLIGVALVASSAAVVNHVADAEIDARMARTQARPMATGRIPHSQALTFSATIGVLGFTILYFGVNALTAWLNLASWVGYGLVYTLYLKRATPQNIVIGGLFGAAPPLFGWTAVTNSLDTPALLLVLIIFVWTPPHFWALALDRKDEYRAAKIPMLPVTHGERVTRNYIFVYTLLLVATTLVPFVIGMSGLLYLSGAMALGAGFIYWSTILLNANNTHAPRATFRYSILYLMLLFSLLLLDHYVLL